MPDSPQQASGEREQRASGSPSPPLEERVGERRPFTIADAAVRGALTVGRPANISGVQVENNDLLSLPLSSKGGEGSGGPTSEHRAACKEQLGSSYPVPRGVPPHEGTRRMQL
jgi:hypothetical protein